MTQAHSPDNSFCVCQQCSNRRAINWMSGWLSHYHDRYVKSGDPEDLAMFTSIKSILDPRVTVPKSISKENPIANK